MSDNGPQNQRNAPRITFGGPSDSTGSNQNGERSGARSKQRRPQGLPNNTASWFTALTQHGKEDLTYSTWRITNKMYCKIAEKQLL